jgi:hypothetical protein
VWPPTPSAASLAAADPKPRKCAVTGRPARYFDPLTQQPYADGAAFKQLRLKFPPAPPPPPSAASAAASAAFDDGGGGGYGYYGGGGGAGAGSGSGLMAVDG